MPPAEYPAHGLVGWDDELKTYIDTADTEAVDAAVDAVQPYVAQAEAAAASASEIALGDADAAMAGAINNPASDTYSALSASLAQQRVGANVARFVRRMRAGENVKITCLGDSILEGQTVTNPATDGTMILLAADLSARFGITVTQTNHATSGFTAFRLFTDGNVPAAINEQADLYIVSAMDKNDLGAEISGVGGLYAPGYPQARSLARIEQMLRAIRREVPKADVIVLTTNPYMPGSSSNAYQDAKDKAVQAVAAAYGAEFVDANASFKALGDWSALMNDSTHPNTAGHRLIADTILAHLEDVERSPIQPAIPAVSSRGIYSPEKTRETVGNLGVVVSLVTGTDLSGSGLAWVNTGAGWTGTGGSSAYTNSTVNDYTEITGQFSDLSLLMSTLDADDPVCDIKVDGVDVVTGQHFNIGKKGTYYVPIVAGLDPTVSHTVRLTVKGGTLKVQRVAALMVQPLASVADLVRTSKVIPLTSATTTLTTTYQEFGSTTLALPSGWGSMDVELFGGVLYRNSGAMTADRTVTIRPLFDNTDLNIIDVIPMPQAAASLNRPVARFAGIAQGVTASKNVKIQARVNDATDTVQVLSWFMTAKLIRRS